MSWPTRSVSQNRRDLLRAIATGGVAVSVAGCSAPSSYERGPGDSSYIAGTTATAQGGLDPLSVGDAVSVRRLNLLYDPGGVIDDDPIEFQGRLLESWELSDDATAVRYRVRDGLEWGGGYGQLTAETYLYNVENVFTAPWTGYRSSRSLGSRSSTSRRGR